MKATPLTEELFGYVVEHTRYPSPVLPRLIEETRALPRAIMQITPDQGALMHTLVKMMGAKRCLEIGCFTGYSAICVASALPPGGRLYTLDVSEEYTSVARRYFREAGLEDRIELRLAPALETLVRLEEEFGPGSFDMAFIDADKANMPAYYEHALRLVRTGGLILADNVLWHGDVVNPKDQREETRIIREFNRARVTDERVDAVLLSVSDGVFLLRKR